ncbi:NUDIX hydrolase [Candidatus Dojkabacteria bacterium]|uniref:NUDIX hydrolase n=1 Tax=Candidatus Dojkabacteria bacterium TaxID=2099670 RepID=A0A955L9D6_9BACT|nr:NUDIX hydrolase [Candidatus Dojkabacteria bacterium]
MKTRLIVCGIIEKNHKLLFGKKLNNVGPYPNTWHLLGGGVKDGESLEVAIKREIMEEANITVEITQPIGFAEDFEPNKHGEMTHYIFLSFLCTYSSGEITPSDDINELQWFAKNKLPQNKLNPPTLTLLRKLNYL